jgi:hypothetical protein
LKTTRLLVRIEVFPNSLFKSFGLGRTLHLHKILLQKRFKSTSKGAMSFFQHEKQMIVIQVGLAKASEFKSLNDVFAMAILPISIGKSIKGNGGLFNQ